MMSVFSIIKRGRAQAKEHNAKQADKEKAEAAKIPYKHIPTHAATDALATAPSSWKQDDRSKIREQNRRRSAMAASSTNHHGLPRVASSLAQVSYPSVYANPVVPLPKNYSYSSVPGSWRERMVSTPETSEEEDYFNGPRDYKGKGKEIVPAFTPGTGGTASPMLSSGRTSPLSSRVPMTAGVGVGVGVGVAISSGSENPGGTEDGEIRTRVVKNFSRNSEFRPSSSRDSSTTGERLHHLHPANARNVSESHNRPDRYYPPHAKSTYFSAPRPTSRRTPSSDVSTSHSPLFRQFYANNVPSSAASSVSSIGMAISTAPTSAVSTPPSSITGETTSAETQTFQLPTAHTAPPARHPRRFSLSEFRRTSSDTIRPERESRERSQSRAPSIRGRRLSKSRPRESVEVAAPASEPDQPASKTPYSLYESNTPSKDTHMRRRLSKGRTPSQARSENTPAGAKQGWSLFGRWNSNKGA
ncbi:hypothetical protein F4861DRAFT_14419 [Xylaria intraflava]|nr:hypothetical protein F4861DRAFT_14419 [Xylaria intraflava]